MLGLSCFHAVLVVLNEHARCVGVVRSRNGVADPPASREVASGAAAAAGEPGGAGGGG